MASGMTWFRPLRKLALSSAHGQWRIKSQRESITLSKHVIGSRSSYLTISRRGFSTTSTQEAGGHSQQHREQRGHEMNPHKNSSSNNNTEFAPSADLVGRTTDGYAWSSIYDEAHEMMMGTCVKLSWQEIFASLFRCLMMRSIPVCSVFY